MTVLHSVDFFPSGNASVAIEPRLPQADFPEHHHDFHEIVIVEHGTGIHVFNGQPYTITGGTVCFVRDHDRHLYEHTDNLCLTNVLYRSPDRFQFLAGLNQLLPQELDGQYPSHWRVNHSVLQQVRQLVAQMEQQEGENDLPSTASREIDPDVHHRWCAELLAKIGRNATAGFAVINPELANAVVGMGKRKAIGA